MGKAADCMGVLGNSWRFNLAMEGGNCSVERGLGG